MFENPRGGRQARNFTTNVSKILDLKSSSEQIFFRKLSLGAPVPYRMMTWEIIARSSMLLLIVTPVEDVSGRLRHTGTHDKQSKLSFILFW